MDIFFSNNFKKCIMESIKIYNYNLSNKIDIIIKYQKINIIKINNFNKLYKKIPHHSLR